MKKLLFGGLVAASAAAAGQAVMTPELLWKLGRVGLDDAAASGWVAYGVTRYDLEANKGNRDLYLVHASTGETRSLATEPGGEYGATFVKGGTRVAYLHQGKLKSRALDGSDVRVHLDVPGGVSDVKLRELANGQWMVAFVTREKLDQTPLERHPEAPKANYVVFDDLMYRHWDSWTDYHYNHVAYAVVFPDAPNPATEFTDLLKGVRGHAPLPPFGGAESFDVSPDGSFIVYSAKLSTGKEFALHTNSKLYRYDVATAQTTELPGLNGYDGNPRISPDGTTLAFTAMPTDGFESDVNQLHLLDLRTPGAAPRRIDVAGEYVNDLKWVGPSSLVLNVTQEASNQLVRLEVKGAKVAATPLTSGDYDFGAFDYAGKVLVAERMDQNQANELYVLGGKAPVALTHANDADYAKIARGKVEKRWIPTSDGKKMLTWVMYPPNFDPAKKYPALLYCQGGPQSTVSAFYSFRWNFQVMAAQGYIVVAPNRRGVPGFGREWNEQISGDWGGQAMKDYLAAIDAVAAEPYVDAQRLGAVGASYGGYSVYQLAGIHGGRFKALVSHCGLFNMESWYGTTEELFFANHDLGGSYWDQPQSKSYGEFNPKNHVAKWTAPLLVIHGGNDFRVPLNQGMEAYQAAQLRGIPSRFLYFPEEGHWVMSPQNALVWQHEFFNWLNQWLKP
ncbi:MAG: S9 family peptidase [Bacteroidota bacterium]